MRLIETDDDLALGAKELVALDPRWKRAFDVLPPLPLRHRASGFGALVAAITSQQVSVASAATIRGRLEAAGLANEAALMAASDEDLRRCGLSRPKAKYLRALAEARLDYDSLEYAHEDHVIDTLTALPGIGRWTAEIYLLFSLKRADAFAAGDLALQLAAADLFDLDARPGEKALRVLAEPWSPWRGVAARALWSWYHHMKGREGV